MPGKTNKSFTKRLKITRRGKILARKAGQDHFNAKSSSRKQKQRKGYAPLTLKAKIINQNLPNI